MQEELTQLHPNFKPLDHCKDHCDLVGNIHNDDYYKLEREQYLSDRVYPHLDLAGEHALTDKDADHGKLQSEHEDAEDRLQYLMQVHQPVLSHYTDPYYDMGYVHAAPESAYLAEYPAYAAAHAAAAHAAAAHMYPDYDRAVTSYPVAHEFPLHPPTAEYEPIYKRYPEQHSTTVFGENPSIRTTFVKQEKEDEELI